MKLTDLEIERLKEAPWNANQMDEAMLSRLKESIKRYGIVENMVVRPIDNERYEVLSGNQRLKVLKEAGIKQLPCVTVNLDDANARLLAQALNHIHGQDDLGLRAELLQQVLETMEKEDILSLLPETAQSLNRMAAMGKETVAEYLIKWQKAQSARLRHLQFQLTQYQLAVVEEVLADFLPVAKQKPGNNPNTRGTALYLLCQNYLDSRRGL
ncbi:MAG: ParB N-terminal domain-containing protein [Dehalococcoidales bacterium]|nr:ParB N-terminal domain-containing protein [Dehalococcoidales bacterium]